MGVRSVGQCSRPRPGPGPPLAAAQSNGTAAFDASGDTAGLECKGGDEWSSPPGPDDIGLDAVASLPEMTSVGGTTLSTESARQWVAEHAWIDVADVPGHQRRASSTLFARPQWQRAAIQRARIRRRLTPDVAAVADPFTGVRIISKQQRGSAAVPPSPRRSGPALTVLMNQYLVANGGRPLGDVNPLLYRVAAGSNLPGFRDVRRRRQRGRRLHTRL